jgi:hypothetical protein
MKPNRWMVAALVSASVVVAYRGRGHQLDPDEQLAGRLEALCDVARDHVTTPAQGVRKLGRYLGAHTGEMLGELGSTIALIEQIADDQEHDERAETARERIHEPLVTCEADWERFAEAVEANPEASELIAHHVERLGRTLEIILSGAKLDVRHLPAQLAHALDKLR